MPQPVGLSPTPPASPAATDATAPAAGAFAELLDRAHRASLPTVSLGRMLDAYSGTDVANVGRPHATPTSSTPPVAHLDRPNALASAAASDARHVGAAILGAGERYLGVPYVWGGTSAETGFDCSGFVQQVFADLGVALPRVSIDQSRSGTGVANLDAARPGDLVFWYGDGSRPNHIGIYAGNDTMLVAPRTGDVVRYQRLTRTPDEIRRILPT